MLFEIKNNRGIIWYEIYNVNTTSNKGINMWHDFESQQHKFLYIVPKIDYVYPFS